MSGKAAESLVIGMPAGSLASATRGGNLIQLLETAGFRTSGYEAGGPTGFPSLTFFYGWDGRPQEFGSQLGIGELDVAIAGDDWIRERTLELRMEYGTGTALEKVLSLKRGNVKIVGIARSGTGANLRELLASVLRERRLVTVVSEMPYLALDWVRGGLIELGEAALAEKFSVQKYKTPPKIAEGIVIYETWGKTEAKVKNGGADFGIEITQTGSAIKNYGLTIVDTIMESESGIWINPEVRKNTEKGRLLDMFLLNLYGTINAEDKVLITFNIRNIHTAGIEEYVRSHSLFADEPTRNAGKDFTEYSIQVNADDRELPLAKIRYDLAVLGAKSIDTIPLSSSIPGIEILGKTLPAGTVV